MNTEPAKGSALLAAARAEQAAREKRQRQKAEEKAKADKEAETNSMRARLAVQRAAEKEALEKEAAKNPRDKTTVTALIVAIVIFCLWSFIEDGRERSDGRRAEEDRSFAAARGERYSEPVPVRIKSERNGPTVAQFIGGIFLLFILREATRTRILLTQIRDRLHAQE